MCPVPSSKMLNSTRMAIVRSGRKMRIPRARHQTSMIAPEIRKRGPASSSVGIDRAPMRMAVKVDPQRIYKQAKARTMLAFEAT